MNKLERELASIEAKLEKLHKGQMQRYRDGTATRAQTTTYNARVSDLCGRRDWIKAELRQPGASRESGKQPV